MDVIYFYSKDESYGGFSNFSNFGIEMNGKWWPTVEHFFQAQKFLNYDYQEEIRISLTAKKAADLGRTRKISIREDWEEIKDSIMYEAVLKKFNTHKKLSQLLLDTSDKLIIENSPYDYYWGSGQDGTGQNKLGIIIMKVRSILQENN